jgi:hypothetical protein
VSVENKTVKIANDDSIAISKTTAVEVIKDDSTCIMTNEDEGLKIKAARAGDSVTDLVDSTLDRMVNAVQSRAKELYKSGALEPGYAAARKDSADIARLGSRVTGLAIEFEDAITMVCDHSYPEQVKILTGYKKLLEEQINVIDSRIHFVKRLRNNI